MQSVEFVEKKEAVLTEQAVFTAGGEKKVTKIEDGTYKLDECNVNIEYIENGVNDATAYLAVRRDFCTFFNSPCEIKIDGQVYYKVENLMSAQEIYWFCNQFYPNPMLQVNAAVGQEYPNIQWKIQALSAADELPIPYEITFKLRDFFPYLFPKDMEFFRIKNEAEISITLGETAGTLASILSTTNFPSVEDAVVADGITLEFNMQKYFSSDVDVKPFQYVQLAEDTFSYSTNELAVDSDDEISIFECYMLESSQAQSVNCGKITFGDLTSCKVTRNAKILINDNDTQNVDVKTTKILEQFESYENWYTGMYILPQFTTGEKFSYESALSSPLLCSMLLVYKKIDMPEPEKKDDKTEEEK